MLQPVILIVEVKAAAGRELLAEAHLDIHALKGVFGVKR